MVYIVIFDCLVGILYVALLVRPMVHTQNAGNSLSEVSDAGMYEFSISKEKWNTFTSAIRSLRELPALCVCT